MSIIRYCDVALRLPVRQLFTYRMSPSLADFVRPGFRVLVPLRRDTVTAIVRRVHTDEPSVAVRDVIDVVDAEPCFSDDLLALGDWIASYYFCGPGEALFAMLPSGLGARIDTVYSHHPDRVPTSKLTPSERRLCLHLSAHPELPRTELLDAFPQRDTSRRLEKLVAQGTIASQRRIRPHRMTARTEPAVEWIGETTDASLQGDELARYLMNASRPVTSGSLTEQFPNAPRVLMRWARRKLVRRVRVPAPYCPELPEVGPEPVANLTPAQHRAVTAIADALGSHHTFLLYGVTGSGKTEVYIRIIGQVLEAGQTALFLVPEIGLASHLLARLTPHFRDQVVVLHSRLSDRERALAWRAVQQGARRLVVGTRSAALAPIDNLGLVVVDEEQDPSFKQDHPAPRYHGRDVAIWRARRHKAVCVLGTATPSLESWHHAQSGKYRLLNLPKRIGDRPVPRVHWIDRKIAPPQTRGGLITPTLESQIHSSMEAGEQVILFLNRRGFSGALRWARCGHVQPCPDCSVAYTYHRDRRQLRCHFCGRAEAAPTVCDVCGSADFVFPRAGTQQVEQELTALFPKARVARLDLDVASRRGRAATILDAFGRHEIDILLGTQMVTKGLHFPRVALVGILNPDLTLDLPDFRAAERTAQQVLQVAGRAGRGDLPGRVYAQTWAPDQPVFALLKQGDYAAFAAAELQTRELLRYPPYDRLVALWCLADAEDQAETAIKRVAGRLGRVVPAPYRVVGPAPAPMRRLRRQHRWQLLLKTARVGATLARLDQILTDTPSGKARFNVDVDPVHLL